MPPPRNQSPKDSYDLVVVGTGPIAALAVREYLDQRHDATVAMLDAGPPLPGRPGDHLINSDPRRLDSTYHRLRAAAQQIAASPETPSRHVTASDIGNREHEGLIPAAFLGHDMTQFPGAVTAWNVGGMGVHWVAACPWPDGPELVPGIPAQTWREQLATAQRHLQISAHGYSGNTFSEAILTALDAALPSPDPRRAAQRMPMAGMLGSPAQARRTGPLDVLPEMDPDHARAVTVLPGTLCTALLTDAGIVTGVRVRDTDGGQERELAARAVIVGADALRTPQLLFASGLGGPALGRYLNEHACVSIQVPVDRARLNLREQATPQTKPGEPFVGAYWLPSRGSAQPIHLQLMETVTRQGHLMRVSAYAPTEVRAENHLEFSSVRSDHLGMPRLRVHFSYSETDLAMIAVARDVQLAAAQAISSVSHGELEQVPLAPPGSSLHYTGTARMGAVDDGTSVCDTTGRVWGCDNLFLVGNATVPTALTCNSTLTSAALAVAAGRAAAAL